MQTKYTILLLVLLINLVAQSQTKTDEKKETSESNSDLSKNIARTNQAQLDILKAFETMIKDANDNYKKSNANTCDALLYIKSVKTEKLLPNNDGLNDIAKKFSYIDGGGKFQLNGEYDKGLYKTLLDKLLASWSNTTDFSSFISMFTEKDIGEVNKKDLKYLEGFYYYYKNVVFNTEDEVPLNVFYPNFSTFYKKEGCEIRTNSTMRQVSYKYPTLNWELKTKVTLNCTCEGTTGPLMVEKALYEYTALASSLYTGTEFIFEPKIKAPQLLISGVSCCSEKTETEKPSSATPTEVQPRIYSGYDDDNNFHWRASIAVGIPLGDESDFYGSNYKIGFGRSVISLKDLEVGAQISYSRFTGKETGFGFETEGVSFIPVEATLDYPLNNIFSLNGSVGYALSATEDVDGGFTFSIGPELSICPSWDVSLGYNSILLGEERSFNSVVAEIHFRF